MSSVIGQTYQYPVRVPKKESVLMTLHFTVSTATAAITVANTVSSDPGFTVTKGATGRYDIVYPLCPSDAVVVVQRNDLESVFPTTGQFSRVSAKAPASGTMSITTSTTLGGAAADLSGGTGDLEFEVWILGALRAGN